MAKKPAKKSTKKPAKKFQHRQFTDTFHYELQGKVTFNDLRVRKELKGIQADLNAGHFDTEYKSSKKNHGREFNMDRVFYMEEGKCGMAGCIGGYLAIRLLGFPAARNTEIVDNLFSRLIDLDYSLHSLFYDFGNTDDYNHPRVAAKAIGRYLSGANYIWPEGKMPGVSVK